MYTFSGLMARLRVKVLYQVGSLLRVVSKVITNQKRNAYRRRGGAGRRCEQKRVVNVGPNRGWPAHYRSVRRFAR